MLKIKKFAAVFICIMLAVAGLSALNVAAAEATASGTCGDNLTWTLDSEGTLTISGTGAMEDFTGSDSTPWYEYNSSVSSLVIEDGVTRIGSWAFQYLENATTAEIADTIVEIGDHAFWFAGLTDITIPDSVVTIEHHAFYACGFYTGLDTITIGSGVETIGGAAFAYCRPTVVTFKDDAPAIGDNYDWIFCFTDAVTYDGEICTAYYPCGNSTWTDEVIANGYGEERFMTWEMYHDYKGIVTTAATETEDGLMTYTCTRCGDTYTETIPATTTVVRSGTCGDNLTWAVYDSGKLEISGTGAMNDFSSAYAMPWCGTLGTGVPDISCVVIDEGVTSIGACAFMYHNYITKVEIPESVTEIGAEAFYDCCSLSEITISSNVESIGNAAFSFCDGLDINVEEDNQYYSSIDGVLFNKDKTEIIVYTKGEESYSIPEGVTSIKAWAFTQCDNLVEITIPAGTVSIGVEAFYSCDNLARIALPDSIESIGEMAFADCTALTDVYYAGTEEDWNLITFDYGYSGLSSATIHYNSSMPTPAISSVTAVYADSILEVTIITENTLSGNSIFAAGYTADGSMSGVSEVTDGQAALPMDTKTVRVFIWNSQTGMKPLCEAAEKII